MTPILIIDAFTDRPFGGNPAAVCLLESPTDDAGWMQRVAVEMNLSETAFVAPQPEAYSLRWFTPATEVELCGHATLASAHALWEEGIAAPQDPIRFDTLSGRLEARLTAGAVQLDFPDEAAGEIEQPAELDAILKTPIRWVGNNRFDLLVEVEDETAVRSVQPDLSLLRRLDYRGMLVTARGSGEFDFVSRCFFPASGVDEDPVTGSAHCCLGPYWAQKLGRSRLRGYQASARGGVVVVECVGGRVLLEGGAVTVVRGELAAGGS